MKRSKSMPTPFEFPAWEGMKRRTALKYIRRLGRNMLKRYEEFSTYKVGDLVNDCTGLNMIVRKAEPVYKSVRNGLVLVDIDFFGDWNSCSMKHCGVEPPRSFEECKASLEHTLRLNESGGGYQDMFSHYKDIVLNPDGTFFYKDGVPNKVA